MSEVANTTKILHVRPSCLSNSLALDSIDVLRRCKARKKTKIGKGHKEKENKDGDHKDDI